MELQPEEISKIKDILSKWLTTDTMELESTVTGPINATAFMEVAQRLTSKGYTALPQEDHIKIMTPEKVRFTIVGMSSIEEYCRTDSLETAPFEAMVKDRTGKEDSADLDEYGIRVKVRRELPLGKEDADVKSLLRGWATKKKAFRILRRWSFLGEGLRFDLSMVRSTPTKRGEYDWQTSFKQRDITRTEPTYEIEVELMRPDTPQTDSAPYMKTLIRGVGEVLRGLQKHHLLMRKTKVRAVIDAYQALTRTERFRGVAPITMILDNMRKDRVPRTPNIRDGYNVTDKADGSRMMAFTTGKGELYMIDMTFNVYKTGLVEEPLKNCLLDGEYVTRDIDGNPIMQLILFDAYIIGGVDVSQKPFAGDDGRHAYMLKWVTTWNSGGGPNIAPGMTLTEKSKIMVSMKTFKFAAPGDKEIFERCKEVLDTKTGYHTDGLILTPNKDPLPSRPGVAFHAQLKWKPADENTVDFLCMIEKVAGSSTEDEITSTILPTGEFVQFKTLRLFVGSDLDPAFENPRGTILFKQPLPGSTSAPTTKRGVGVKVPYKPVLFNPRDIPDTMSAVCYLNVETDPITDDTIVRCENDGDAIQDRSIVEMRYDASKEPGWRWIPMRIRYDKTERYLKALKTGNYGGTMNKDTAAEGVWNSIHEPITRSMIRTGAEQPSAEEVRGFSAGSPGSVARVYYNTKAPKQDLQSVQGLRGFHNRFIKENILLATGLKGGKKVLMDFACGQGGDLVKWVREDAAFVFGVDVAGEGIRDPMNGIYRRYLNQILENGGYDSVGTMVFAIGSSAKNIASGEAGSTPEEADIMRSVLGKVNPNGPVPPFVLERAAGRLREGADCIAIMFALHYFFESEASLAGIIQNISDSLKVGGVFIGCCFDGEAVFNSLRALPEGGTKVGQEGGEIWKIKKKYSNTFLAADAQSLGLPIEVDFISIGTSQTEYLMNFKLLTERMNDIGCYLMNKQECADAGIPFPESTAMFSDTYDVAKKQKQNFAMSPAVREYSFYNRWFIFKRKSTGRLGEPGAAPGVPGVPSASASVPVPAPAAPAVPAGPVVPAVVPAVAPHLEPSADAKAQSLAQMQKAKYTATQLIQFYIDSPLTDKLGVGDVEAVRWLGPYAPVPVKDDGVVYPTIDHYMAAMLYKVATNKPHLAVSLFSAEQGELHREFLTERARKLQTVKAKNPKAEPTLTKAEEYLLIKSEIAKVHAKMSTTDAEGLYSYKGIQFDEGKWLSMRGAFLTGALKQRWDIDPLLRKTVEAVRDKAKILVYYTGENSGSYMGATFRSSTKTLDGQNAYGIELMRLGGFRSV
jgi:SAM-dependent methyltransferase